MNVEVNGLTLEIRAAGRGIEVTRDHGDRIAGTLRLVPVRHAALIHHIGIRDRADYEGGSTNRVSRRDPSAGLWIMLDIDSFDPRQRAINNRPPDLLHYTLLHELGHVVDAEYRGTRWVRRHERAGYRAMMAREHRGDITTGPGEHFADTYADFFFWRESEMATDARMTALLASPAFAGLTVARRP